MNEPNADLPAAVRAVTDNAYDKLSKRYTPEELERAKIGYEKANEFIRRFVQAGGILKEGSDPPRGTAALLMHQALAMDVEAGVPPMTAIQAATLNVARTFRKDKDYGSVESGKVADLSIVEGDPLQDIWMTQNVKMVVMDMCGDGHIDALDPVLILQAIDTVLDETHAVVGVRCITEGLEKRPACRTVVDEHSFSALANDRIKR